MGNADTVKAKSVSRVGPLERFNVRDRRKVCRGPECGRKTLVRCRQLDAMKPAVSPFPEVLREVFDQVETRHDDAILDFYCRGCGRPVRLLYWMHERGMNGP